MSSATKPAGGIHTIPTGISFLEALTDGLWRMSDGDPKALPRMTVLLPNRRACRALQESFLEKICQGGGGAGAALLPRLLPIGEIDEDDLLVLSPTILGEAVDIPPAIGPLRRRMMLARLILALGKVGGTAPRLDQATQLAQALCRLMDEVETEGLSLDRLDGLVSGELARHWQVTLDFFDLLRRQWPAILAAEGAIDPAHRRNRLLELQARLWTACPPVDPVIVAGSTGTIPASANLMTVVAGLPQGVIVLPGLDTTPDDEDWAAIEHDPSHPQYGMAQLLRRLGVTRNEVALWPVSGHGAAGAARAKAVSVALLPAACTHVWQDRSASAIDGAGWWSGLHRIDCRNEQDEALVIAICLRRFLAENETGIAALVTPDRRLAQRVAGELRRWSIEIDDSAGRPLSRSAPGIFLMAIAEAARQAWAPVALLALLKHPLCALGQSEGAITRWAGTLERRLLRGPRPAPGWDGLDAALLAMREAAGGAPIDELRGGIDALRQATQTLADWQLEQGPARRLAGLIAAAEALCQSDNAEGTQRLYAGEDGEALAGFLNDALDACAGLPASDAPTFEALLLELLSGVDVRPRFGKHPRLFIWGPLEARLQQAQLMILGSLNEGTWPAEGADDPWMSRPMRRRFGLQPLERQVGLAAHDFQQALGAATVVMTRAMRVDGQPTVPSRWLLRLDALRACMGLDELSQAAPEQSLARLIDDAGPPAPCVRPAPAPGARWRPLVLSVTRIEAWRRDPYAIYASKILRLRRLDDLDQDPDQADLGTVIHRALDRYLALHAERPPADPFDRLLAIGREAFGELLERPRIWAFWWPRFERIARWFLDTERELRPSIRRTLTEIEARARIVDGAIAFDLTAKADRIDIANDSSIAIIDYKTGGVPVDRDIQLGYAPQLALEAWLARTGAFRDLPATADIGDIAYWRLGGGDSGGEILRPKRDGQPLDPNALAAEAEAGLRRLLDHYGRDEARYPALPDQRFAPRYNDYDHLERIGEWSSGEARGR